MADEKSWHFGNAAEESTDHRGWFVGNFMEPSNVRMSKDDEIKWGIHVAGDERAAWHEAEHRTTVSMLIKGRFRINLAVGSHVLATEGDYAMWGPGVGHSLVFPLGAPAAFTFGSCPRGADLSTATAGFLALAGALGRLSRRQETGGPSGCSSRARPIEEAVPAAA